MSQSEHNGMNDVNVSVLQGKRTILHLLVQELVQFAGAECPVPAFSEPH